MTVLCCHHCHEGEIIASLDSTATEVELVSQECSCPPPSLEDLLDEAIEAERDILRYGRN